jgi:FMN phosphatase YigB (HAD superfamily)
VSRFGAVFFDLDGTLLDVDMTAFLAQYLRLAAARLAHLIPPDHFVPHLLRATNVMVENDGRATNEAVFWEAFTPLVKRERSELEPAFEALYAEDFPQLQALTRRKEEAHAVVETALASGCDVLITTNPVFPRRPSREAGWAVWATSLPVGDHHENSRYWKPDQRFRRPGEELGRSPAECLVIGDEDMDMVAARAGYPTFLISSPTTNLSPTTPNPTHRGSLADVAALFRSQT